LFQLIAFVARLSNSYGAETGVFNTATGRRWPTHRQCDGRWV